MLKYINNQTDRKLDGLKKYLFDHDKDFPIPLSNKVDLDEYIKKINKLGKSIIWLDEENIVGIVFYYDNNIKENKAFISLVSVDKNYRNQGIARKMLNTVFKQLRKKGIYLCELPTHVLNHKALNLYNSLGFEKQNKVQENGNILLIKKL